MELMAASLKLSLASMLEIEHFLREPVILDILWSLEDCIRARVRWAGCACGYSYIILSKSPISLRVD